MYAITVFRGDDHTLDLTFDDGTDAIDITDTGPNITVNVPTGQIDFSGLVAGSQVVVFETGTQTEVFRTNSSSTTETTGSIDAGTYDYTIRKADRLFIHEVGVTVGTTPVARAISQELDRAYSASSGLTFGTTATINTTSKEFAVTTATTVQNWYSFWKEAYIAQATLANEMFHIGAFGSASFSLNEDYEFTSGSIQYLSRDGFRYVSAAGAVTAQYAALKTPTQPAGTKIFYLVLSDGTTPHPDFSLFEGEPGESYTPPTSTLISLPNVTDGSTVGVYNITTDTQLDFEASTSGGYSISLTSGVEYTVGDVIEIRQVLVDGVTAMTCQLVTTCLPRPM